MLLRTMPSPGQRPTGLASWYAAATLLVAAATPASAEKPPVAPGVPLAGPAVIMLTTGIDYTKPSVARKLARDGEGDLVGWDAVDRDRRPYGTDPDQSRLVEIAPVRVMPVRVNVDDPASLVEAAAFVRRTASRVVVVPLPLLTRAESPEVSALLGSKDLLIVLAGHTDASQVLAPEVRERVIMVGALAAAGSPASGTAGLDVILLPPAAAREAPGDGERAPRNAAEAAILFVAQLSCRRAELAAAKDPRDAKRILLSLARKEPGGGPPVLEDCTRSLAPR